jgi:hypothetical protein
VTRVIYLAQPIDADSETNNEWVALRAALPAFASWVRGVVAYAPAAAFKVGWDTAPVEAVEKINRSALVYADGLVAILPKNVPTVGVPRELEFAHALGLPTAVVTDIENSFSLAGENLFPLTADGFAAAMEHVRDSERPSYCPEPDEIAVLLGEGSQMPSRANPTDAGFDCYVSEDVTVAPGEFADVPLNLRVAMPDSGELSQWLQVRSSTAFSD